MEQIIFITIIIFIVAEFVMEIILERLNLLHHKKKYPEEMNEIMDPSQYARSVDYHLSKYRFSLIAESAGLVLILIVLLFDILPSVSGFIRNEISDPVWIALLFFGLIALFYDIFGMPFDIYNTFVIEEKFGFNRTTIRTYITDKLKGYFLAIIIGGLLMFAFAWFYLFTGKFFWLYLWIIYTVFSILMLMFHTTLIVPLFNKLSPLPDGELKNEIILYCSKNGFSLKNLFVMDGSRRSTKANAFFSGLGVKKSIILFDTLIRDHTIPEIIAVLAHEVGHYRKKHTRKMLVMSIVQTFIIMYLLSLFINYPFFPVALGAKPDEFYIGLIGFGILFSPISTLVGIGMNLVSRSYEKEADRFAAETSSAAELASALKKLSVNQLSNLNPHPAYVFVHYSHPALLERLRFLKEA